MRRRVLIDRSLVRVLPDTIARVIRARVTSVVRCSSSCLLVCGLALLTSVPLSSRPSYAESDAPAAASTPAAGDTRTSDLDHAKAEMSRLLTAKQFGDAIVWGEKALQLSEAQFGAEAGQTATAAHNLGFVLRRAGKDQDALPLLERARTIYQRTKPAVHEDMRNLAGEIGQIYVSEGRTADAAALYDSLIARAGREGDGQHVGVAYLRTNLAFLWRTMGRHDDSQDQFEKALAIYAQASQPGDEGYAAAVEALVSGYLETSKFDKARAAVSAALQKIKSTDGASASREILTIRLSEIEHAAGNFVQSRQLSSDVLDMRDPAHNSTGLDLIEPLNNLARAEKALANYRDAEQAYARALAIAEAQGAAANAGIFHDNLGVLYNAMGRFEDAEVQHKRAIQLLQDKLGTDHAVVGEALGNLGALMFQTGRFAEAEPLLKRALDSAEHRDPPNLIAIAILSDNLSGVYRMTQRPVEALKYLRRALELFEKSLPADHPSIATGRNNLGRYLLDVGSNEEAETQLLQALKISEKAFGAPAPANALALSNLGELYLTTKRLGPAREVLTRAIGILDTTVGPMHPGLVLLLVRLGRVELADGHASAAVSAFERAVKIEIAQRALGATSPGSDPREAIAGRQAFDGLIEAQWQAAGQNTNAVASKAMETGQWGTMTAAAQALNALAARFGTDDSALGRLVRERQDLTGEWSIRDKRLTEALWQGNASGSEKPLRERLVAIEAQIKSIDGELQTQYPRFKDFAQPAPASVAEIQGLLHANEAALQFLVTPDATHVWVVTKTGLKWVRVAISDRNLSGMIDALRCGLDRSQWIDANGTARCAKLLGFPNGYAVKARAPLPFDSERAHNLYKMVLGPLSGEIAGKDLVIVPTGPLAALPFHVLVSAPPPKTAAGKDVNYAQVAWLARDHAITIVPSLASLKALRSFAKVSAAKAPFKGFGNPLLSGTNGTDRRAWAHQTCDGITAKAAPEDGGGALLQSIAQLFRGGLGNVESLRLQPPLPETADELCLVAQKMRAANDNVYLGERATEQTVKAQSQSGELASVRVIHFATHGLLASETAMFSASRNEPALLLTPPPVASADDDGLLTASEIAALKLDADWVVLSACNTASGSGAGAESLSGLARSFFYSGARSLLVSHWAVNSDAAVRLVTASFDEMGQNPAAGRASALRRAMMALVASGGQAAHPAFWAPFVIVGEGGAGEGGPATAAAPGAASLLPAPASTRQLATVPVVVPNAKEISKPRTAGKRAKPKSDPE